ncbi:MAG: T9SS type A sorting domain-containing protein [Sphingobacteriaceae bacterium]|nr:MAG: T9SS type A sorting domain-containing protein [Sphingobacteriaceae bacterium]
MNASYLFAIILTIASLTTKAQQGCTDPNATNYNSTARINDGSCAYAATHYTPVLRAALPTDIPESSGLAWTDGRIWTHNDSGDPIIYNIDTTDGHVLQTVIVDNFPNTDWEDITADDHYIYIGDFGNNNGDRTDLKILKVAKADITTADTVHLNAQAIQFSYSDQTDFTSRAYAHDYDCEAMIAVNDSLYIFTKNWSDKQTRVYQVAKAPGIYSVVPNSSYNINGLVTGASYNTATEEIALVGYIGLFSNSFLWFLNDYQNHSFFTGNKRRIEVAQLLPWQTEGIVLISANRFMISNESTPGNPSAIYLGAKDWLPATNLNDVLKHSTNYRLYPNPCNNAIALYGLKGPIEATIINAAGNVLSNEHLNTTMLQMNTECLPSGNYFLKLKNRSGIVTLPFSKQ